MGSRSPICVDNLVCCKIRTSRLLREPRSEITCTTYLAVLRRTKPCIDHSHDLLLTRFCRNLVCRLRNVVTTPGTRKPRVLSCETSGDAVGKPNAVNGQLAPLNNFCIDARVWQQAENLVRDIRDLSYTTLRESRPRPSCIFYRELMHDCCATPQ